MKIILDLFITFLKISTFTLGGGPSMLPLIEKYAVDEKGWITKEEFVDMAALSQSIPGPIAVDAAVYIGYKSAGILGSLAAVFGSVLSAFIVLLVIAMYFTNISDNKVVEAVFKGVRPAVVALLVLPVISMWKASKINKKTIAIPLITVILVAFFNVNAVYIIIVSALGGILYGLLRKRGTK